MIAEDWVRDHHSDTWWQEGTEKFLSLLPPHASILDVGCGAGVKTRYITQKGFKVTGIDFSEKMIEIARRESPDIPFEVLDMYELEKHTVKYDGVFAQASLLHIRKERIQEVVSQLRNILVPGGLLYIAVKGIREDGVQEDVKKEYDYGYEYERFFSYYSLSELETYLTQAGMDVLWTLDTLSGRTHWLQIVGKRG